MSHRSCKCPQCWGLAEAMMELTGKDYGLPRSPGHAIPKPEPEPAPVIQLLPRPRVRQPWEARPARAA